MLDPMSQFEEDRKLKEAAEFRDLCDTIVLDDYYISSRDLVGKGKDVHPSGKQRKEVHMVADSFRFGGHSSRRKSGGGSLMETAAENDNDSNAYVDLCTGPRTFICSGQISRLEPDSLLRKFSKRILFIFNDVLILCTKKESAEFFDVQQILWVNDLRIKHLHTSRADSRSMTGNIGGGASGGTGNFDYQFCFELIVAKNRKRPQYSVILKAEDEASMLSWISDIESVLLAYHRDSELSNQIGWWHEVIQGTYHSAAYHGDSVLLRKHLRVMHAQVQAHIEAAMAGLSVTSVSQSAIGGGGAGIDGADESGMTALHWAALRGHEVCVRILLDRGADVDALNKGLNTPLLLAAVAKSKSETVVRLLVERGADLTTRNLKDHDVVFMSVLYGHASKDLPWLLQLLNSKGLDLNAPDSNGATPLHLCAKKNLSRPIRMLVDSGADVNCKHGTTNLTPLQMACAHSEPDVETIRSFLDKGAYPNWRDLQGRTAFDIVLQTQQQKQQQGSNPQSGSLHSALSQNFFLESSGMGTNSSIRPSSNKYTSEDGLTDTYADDDGSSDGASNDGEDVISTNKSGKSTRGNTGKSGSSFKGFSSKKSFSGKKESNSNGGLQSEGGPGNDSKWRAMENTLLQVGDWAVKALPALLEISKRGGRCRPQQEPLFMSLRPSFRAAIEEAQVIWKNQKQPGNFLEFVMVREHSGEDLRLHKENWTKDKNSPFCQLCSETFSIRIRRHHCRSCGVLCCDDCSSKRLTLSAVNLSESDVAAAQTSNNTPTARGGKPANDENNSQISSNMERVCDGCFNRLLHEAAQPSPDHFRVKQLKRCALDVIQALEDLVGALDDPEGDPDNRRKGGFSASGREVVSSGRLTEPINGASETGGVGSSTPKFNLKFKQSASTQKEAPAKGSASPEKRPISGRSNSIVASPYSSTGTEALISALKSRDSKLSKAEDLVAKFLEASQGYHQITKKLIEQKMASNRLWGAPEKDLD